MNSNIAAPVALGPTCAACNDAEICTEAGAHHTVTEFTATEAAAKRAEEDAIWEAEGRRVAQQVVGEQVAAMEDHILDAFRTGLHRERGELVNLYTGADRKQKIADLDLVIGAVEEEQAKRAGLASSADILASFAAP